jgi:hypothetical protein
MMSAPLEQEIAVARVPIEEMSPAEVVLHAAAASLEDGDSRASAELDDQPEDIEAAEVDAHLVSLDTRTPRVLSSSVF